MKTHLKVRNAALVAALAAVTATAYATNEYVTAHSDTVVAPTETIVTTTTIEPVAPVESLTTNETVVTTPASPAESAPLLNVPSTPITIEDRRLTLDERIQADVMDKLASAPNISGKIGVESKDAVVTLTGYTSTSAQAYRAGRYAGSVEGVKYVQNDIRGRIGGSY